MYKTLLLARELVSSGLTYGVNASKGEDGSDKTKIRPGLLIFLVFFVYFAHIIFTLLAMAWDTVITLTCVEDPTDSIPADLESTANERLLLNDDDASEGGAYSDNDDENPTPRLVPKPRTPSVRDVTVDTAHGAAGINPGMTVTSSFTSTLSFLRARTQSRRSPFRGFWCRVFAGFVFTFVFSVLNGGMVVRASDDETPTSSRALSSLWLIAKWLIAGAAASPFNITKMHIIISEPSVKNFWRRTMDLPRGALIRLVPLHIGYDLISLIALSLPIGVLSSMLLSSVKGDNPTPPATGKVIGALIVFCFLMVLVLFVPLLLGEIVLTRVTAAYLPENYNYILQPEAEKFAGARLGGQFGLQSAWKSFSWRSRMRTVKLVGQFVCVVVGYTCAVAIVVGLTLPSAFGGKEGFREVIRRIGDALRGSN